MQFLHIARRTGSTNDRRGFLRLSYRDRTGRVAMGRTELQGQDLARMATSPLAARWSSGHAPTRRVPAETGNLPV